MTRARRLTDIDAKFQDPPELQQRLVSALGNEMSDEALTPGEFRAFRQETIDILKRLTDGQDEINRQLLPLIADHGERLTSLERRVAELEVKRKKGNRP